MTRSPWIRAPMMPEHCREIESPDMFKPLARQVGDLTRLRAGTVQRLRATPLPMPPGQTLIEAQIATRHGVGLGGFLWNGDRLSQLDGQIEVLSIPLHQFLRDGGVIGAVDWLAYARVFCAALRAQQGSFLLCRDPSDLALGYELDDLAPDVRALIAAQDYGFDDASAPMYAHHSAVMAYDTGLFRVTLAMHDCGRLEMLEDAPICDLPPPLHVKGRRNFMFLRSASSDV